ncbi:MAG: hypothetical protein ACT4PE_17005 [Candidatus Eiseniibacteriota bacterium]
MKRIPPSLWLLAAFVASRLALPAAGVRFDMAPLGTFYQFLDPVLLRDDLVRSIAHLHMQPPLFNLLLGVVLKIVPEHPETLFAPLWAAVGAASVLALHATMIRLGVGGRLAFAAALLFALSPAVVLYENHLFYTHLVTAMLSVSAWLAHRFAERGRAADGVALFALLAVVTLTRALFHLAWLVAVVLLFVIVRRGDRRRVIACAAVPVAVVVAWYTRTWILFGSFAASSWFGMNFAEITLEQASPVERMYMVRDGLLSRYAVIAPFQPMLVYRHLRDAGDSTGVPALDEEMKSTGERNFNHIEYVEISRQYLSDALCIVRERPEWYLKGIRNAVLTFFQPATSDSFLAENRARLAGAEGVWRIVTLGGWLVPVVFAAALGYAAVRSLRALRGGRLDAADVTVLYLCANLVYVTLVGTLVDVGENYRFRFKLGPHVAVLVTLAVARLVPRQSVQPSREAETRQ